MKRKTRRAAKQKKKVSGGGLLLPDPPKDASGNLYTIFYANPISDFVGYSTVVQFETGKFNAYTRLHPHQKRPIKIGDNFAYKFFYLSGKTDTKWFVTLNVQLMKNWFFSKHSASNLEIFGLKPDAMWIDPTQENNISNKPANNAIVLRFNPLFVKKDTSEELEIDPTELIKMDPMDPIVRYLRLQTFGKEILKEEANNIAYDGFFSYFFS